MEDSSPPNIAFIVSEEHAKEFLSGTVDTRMLIDKFTRVRDLLRSTHRTGTGDVSVEFIEFLDKKISELEGKVDV